MMRPPVLNLMTATPNNDEQQRRWCADAPAWARWEPYFASSSWPVTFGLIAALRLTPEMSVLDVGCGIGDPSLQIAATLGPTGRVLGIDFADEMVRIAERRARALQLANVRFQVTDIDRFDGPEASFNAVSARFSIMFFPDLAGGLRKLRRLLKPGGRIAVSTWTPHDVNPMFEIPSRRLAAVAELQKPPEDAPGPLRLAGEGALKEALTDAGFRDVDVHDVIMYNFAKSPEEYFEWLCDMSSPFRKQFDSLSTDDRRRVREGVMADVSRYADDGGVRVPARARLGCAAAPPP